MVVPYPNTAAPWFTGEYATKAETYRKAKRGGQKFLAFYQGGNHGECVILRKQISRELEEDEESVVARHGFSGEETKLMMHSARFCPCPVGDSPSAKRMYDVVLAGCIPVIVSDEFVYALWGLMGNWGSGAAFD